MFFRKFPQFSGYSSPSSSTIRSALWENAHPSLAAVGLLLATALATAGGALLLISVLSCSPRWSQEGQHQKTVTNCICKPKQHSWDAWTICEFTANFALMAHGESKRCPKTAVIHYWHQKRTGRSPLILNLISKMMSCTMINFQCLCAGLDRRRTPIARRWKPPFPADKWEINNEKNSLTETCPHSWGYPKLPPGKGKWIFFQLFRLRNGQCLA